MAIDCKSPCSPYVDEVQSFLEARVKGISLDLNEEIQPSNSKEDDDDTEVNYVPAHLDDQPELHASDISNVTLDTGGGGGGGGGGGMDNNASFSLSAGESSMIMDASMASSSFLDYSAMGQSSRGLSMASSSFLDYSAMEHSSRTSKLSKEERKKRKRLNKKKNKYSQMLDTSYSGNKSCSFNTSYSGNKSCSFTLGDLINDLQGNEQQKTNDVVDREEEEEGDQTHHQSFPASSGSSSGITLAALISDLREEEEKADEGAKDKNNNNPLLNESITITDSDVKGENNGGNDGNQDSKSNQESLIAPRRSRSRSNTRTKRTSGRLPRKSKSIDDSDKERFKAMRRNSLVEDNSTGTSNTGNGKRIPDSRRQERGTSVAKDGLAAISAHASTNTRPKEIGRKIKLQRALSDYGHKSCGVLDFLSATDNNINNNDELSPVADPKVDRRRNIKKTVNDLAKSQSRLQEANLKGKSPVPVRMPSRRSVVSKLLPTTAVTSRAAANKIGSVAAAGGIVIPRAGSSSKSFATSNSEGKSKVEDTNTSGGTANDSAFSRRQIIASKLSKSERNLSVAEAAAGITPRASKSFSGRRRSRSRSTSRSEKKTTTTKVDDRRESIAAKKLSRSRSRSTCRSEKKTTTKGDDRGENMAAKISTTKSESNLAVGEAAGRTIPRASKSFTASKSERKLKIVDDMSSSVQGSEKSCGAMARRATMAAKLSKSERYLAVEDLNVSHSHHHHHRHHRHSRNNVGSRSHHHSESVPYTTKDDLSRSVHGTSDTIGETPRHVRRSRAAAPDFDWKKFASKYE